MSARVTCITDRIRARLARPLTEPERARKLVAERLAEAGAESARTAGSSISTRR